MGQRRNKKRASSVAKLRYGIHPSPFGKYLFAVTAGGEVCVLSFLGRGGAKNIIAQLKKDRRGEEVIQDEKYTQKIAEKIFASSKKSVTIPLVMCGTDFEMKVWDALMDIPEGQVTTYSDIAHKIKAPNAVRAVGSACGKNSIAYLIPCHRALPKKGGMGGYKWGLVRKKALLAWEMSKA